MRVFETRGLPDGTNRQTIYRWELDDSAGVRVRIPSHTHGHPDNVVVDHPEQASFLRDRGAQLTETWYDEWTFHDARDVADFVALLEKHQP